MTDTDPKQWTHEPPVLARENWYKERLLLLSRIITFRVMKGNELSDWLVDEYNELTEKVEKNGGSYGLQ